MKSCVQSPSIWKTIVRIIRPVVHEVVTAGMEGNSRILSSPYFIATQFRLHNSHQHLESSKIHLRHGRRIVQLMKVEINCFQAENSAA